MEAKFDTDVRHAIRSILARKSYEDGHVRIVKSDLRPFNWLVTTNQGLFAVSVDDVALVAHGWFFGLHREGEHIYIFENCGMRYRAANMGRIIRFRWTDGHLNDPEVLVAGLHGNAHQLKIIDGLLCLVDTANQRILRYTLGGELVDIKTPFPPVSDLDTSGAYVHMNSLAPVRGRIAVLLQNGKTLPRKKSVLVWLNAEWGVDERFTLDGYKCHDIVLDGHGRLWHSASESGEVISDDGQRLKISDSLMTRAIAFSGDHMLVGLSSFGPREIRDSLAGAVVILDSQKNEIRRHPLPAGPTDVIELV
jgi:hypothetical protein